MEEELAGSVAAHRPRISAPASSPTWMHRRPPPRGCAGRWLYAPTGHLHRRLGSRRRRRPSLRAPPLGRARTGHPQHRRRPHPGEHRRIYRFRPPVVLLRRPPPAPLPCAAAWLLSLDCVWKNAIASIGGEGDAGGIIAMAPGGISVVILTNCTGNLVR
jgi:hypothetical protein